MPFLARNSAISSWPCPEGARRSLPAPLQHAIYLGVGLYGGAFQAGLGIPLLLALVGVGGLDLVRANSIKVALWRTCR